MMLYLACIAQKKNPRYKTTTMGPVEKTDRGFYVCHRCGPLGVLQPKDWRHHRLVDRDEAIVLQLKGPQ